MSENTDIMVSNDATEVAETIDAEHAKKGLLECYKREGSVNFIEHSLNRLEDPIQPQTDKGKRRYHPLLISGVLVFLVVVATFLYFTFKH
jgi:hypothetical protein